MGEDYYNPGSREVETAQSWGLLTNHPNPLVTSMPEKEPISKILLVITRNNYQGCPLDSPPKSAHKYAREYKPKYLILKVPSCLKIFRSPLNNLLSGPMTMFSKSLSIGIVLGCWSTHMRSLIQEQNYNVYYVRLFM